MSSDEVLTFGQVNSGADSLNRGSEHTPKLFDMISLA
jgi:hypothetical protein